MPIGKNSDGRVVGPPGWNPSPVPRIMDSNDSPFCCRCKAEFRIATEPASWRMGEMRKLKKAPKRIQGKYQEWLKSETHGDGYLCGNCYFDLTDE